MKPFIKWPGGKDSELKYILPAKPKVIRNYIEPFLGGGAVFFAIKDDDVTGNFYLNDLSNDLINTYRFVKTRNEDFFDEMNVIDVNNKKMKEIVYFNLDRIRQLFSEVSKIVLEEYYKIENTYGSNFQQEKNIGDKHINASQIHSNIQLDININEKTDKTRIEKEILKVAEQKVTKVRNELINKFIDEISDDIQLQGNLNYNFDFFVASIKRMVVRRMNALIIQSNTLEKAVINLQDVFECIFKSAFYMHLREIYNKRNDLQEIFNQAQISAIYLYIRDNCYSAMHRTNPKGEFNVPYGGISYNMHDFQVKKNHLLEEQLQERLQRAEIFNEDFENFLNRLERDTTSEDFWFVDPPYDTTFSEYSQNEFGQKDHIRLAELLSRTEAKIMVVIKKTEFIDGLYSQYDNFYINTFSKLYGINFHNRNKREVEHLIITNYEIKES